MEKQLKLIKQDKNPYIKSNKDMDFIELAFNNIVAETEKAICLNLMVSWNGECQTKDIWFPKSTCEIREAKYDKTTGLRAWVKSWMLEHKSQVYASNGYRMYFETAFYPQK